MSYNIRAGFGPEYEFSRDDPLRGLRKVAHFIERFSPDIVALQEVDRFMARTGVIDQAAWLAQELDMQFAHSPSYLAEITHPNGRARYGNALLTRHPIVWSEAIHLFHRGWLLPTEASWVNEPRSAIEVTIKLGEQRLTAYSVHLSTTADQQAVQVDQLVKLLQHVEGPQVIMGDFNTALSSSHMKPILAEWTSALQAAGVPEEEQRTYPSGRDSRVAIDHIFVSSHLRVVDASVIVDEEGVSDHNPVLATLQFKEAESAF